MTGNDSHGPYGGIANEAYDRIQQGEARAVNVEAGRALAEAVRTTLGPKGMDKMLVDSLGGVVLTNDGATIIREMDFDNQAAQMIAEVANTQDDAVGDGTTTSVVLAGMLLGEAQSLFERDIHPTTVISGYQRAAEKVETVYSELAIDVDEGEVDVLHQVCRTAMANKVVGEHSEIVSNLVVDAVRSVERDGEVDTDALQIECIPGGMLADSELVDGTVIEQTPAHPSMPEAVDDAGVGIVDSDIEPDPQIDATVSVTSISDTKGFVDQRKRRCKVIADSFADASVDVLFVTGEVDAEIAEYLAQNDVLVADQTADAAIERVAEATDADVVSKVNAFGERTVGRAGRVEITEIDYDKHVFIEDCDGSHVTLLLRGGTKHAQDELERAILNAISAVSLVLESRQVCPGGGAPEALAAFTLRTEATEVSGREQLAIEAFADALEAIPRTLAESAGMDPIDTLTTLRHRYSSEESDSGVDVMGKSVTPMVEAGVVEPLDVKSQSIFNALQASAMLLRIDDIMEAEELPDTNEGDMAADMPR